MASTGRAKNRAPFIKTLGLKTTMLTDEQKEEAYIILGYTAMVSGGAEQKVKWAMYMLESGAESDDLAILATFTPLFNDFEVEDYFNRVLTQLKIKKPDKKEAIYGYVKAMVKKALQNEVMPDEVVAKIYRANIKLDYPSELGEIAPADAPKARAAEHGVRV